MLNFLLKIKYSYLRLFLVPNPICGMTYLNATSPQYHRNLHARPERATIATLRQSRYESGQIFKILAH